MEESDSRAINEENIEINTQIEISVSKLTEQLKHMEQSITKCQKDVNEMCSSMKKYSNFMQSWCSFLEDGLKVSKESSEQDHQM